jgi:hypothetical protein
MTLEGWRARERPTVTVDGLESSLGLFGLDAEGKPAE